MPDYRPLTDYIRRRGGMRVAMHQGLVDRMIAMAVEEFPHTGCPDEALEDVLRARLSIRIKREYSSVVAALLISVLANLITRLIVEWIKRRQSHRVLMYGWSENASKNPYFPPTPPAA